MSDVSVTLIDDSSPEVVYTGDWQRFDNVPLSFETYNNTLTYSNTNGSTAVFNFTGSIVAVQLFALFNGQPPQATFVLDESSPSVWKAQFSDNGTIVAAFQSTTLSDSAHSLQIVVGEGNAPVYLDAIGIGSQGPSNSQGGGFQTTIPVPSSTAAAVSSGSKVPVGAIVGGIVGGVALLLASFLALYFLCWRRRHKQPYYYSSATPGELLAEEAKQISPFPPSNSQQPSSVVLPPPSTYSSSNVPLIAPPSSYGGQVAAYPPSSFGESSDHSSSSGMARSAATLSIANSSNINTAGLTIGQRKALEAGLRTMPESSGFQHADSGVRFNETGAASGSAAPQDAPPVYTAQ